MTDDRPDIPSIADAYVRTLGLRSLGGWNTDIQYQVMRGEWIQNLLKIDDEQYNKLLRQWQRLDKFEETLPWGQYTPIKKHKEKDDKCQ